MNEPGTTKPPATSGAPSATPAGMPNGGTEQPSLRKVGDDIRQAARDAGEAGGQAASDIAAEASAAAGTLKREGAALLEDAKGQAARFAEEGRQAGAAQAQGLARAIHRAAEDLEQESPQLASTIHEAAGAVDRVSRALREKSPGEMFRGIEDFARRQPLVFFGAAALAGFALTRFARASSTHPHAHAPGTTGSRTTGIANPPEPHIPARGGTAVPGHVPGPDGAPRPATLASASLGGAAAYRPPGSDKA